MSESKCACGCGRPIPRGKIGKYFNKVHRKRAHRERQKIARANLSMGPPFCIEDHDEDDRPI